MKPFDQRFCGNCIWMRNALCYRNPPFDTVGNRPIVEDDDPGCHKWIDTDDDNDY